MTTPRYLPVVDFKQWTRDDMTGDDALIEAAINAAEEWIDDHCQRRFVVASGSATARSFRPDDAYTTMLWVGDCVSVSSVVENSVTLVAGTDYQAEPLNALDPMTGNARPYDRLVRLNANWYRNGLTATITVTADWGWAAIPAGVVEACKFLTNDWLSNRDVRGGVVGATGDGFSIGVRKNPNVVRALHPYRHPNSYGI